MKEMKEMKRICFYSLSNLIIISMVYIGVELVILYYAIEVSKNEIIKNDILLTDVEKAIISNKTKVITSDILYACRHRKVK
ncbi:MAG: hypothetical protein ACERKZ_10725 [Lachnotalea sp.]